jgi:hypothetical protein
MGIGDLITDKKKQVEEWLKLQSTPVEIAVISGGSAVQGSRLLYRSYRTSVLAFT